MILWNFCYVLSLDNLIYGDLVLLNFDNWVIVVMFVRLIEFDGMLLLI